MLWSEKDWKAPFSTLSPKPLFSKGYLNGPLGPSLHLFMPRHHQSSSNPSWDPSVLPGEEEVGGGASRGLACSGGWGTRSRLAGQWTAGPQMQSMASLGLSALLHLHLIALEGTAPSPQ